MTRTLQRICIGASAIVWLGCPGPGPAGQTDTCEQLDEPVTDLDNESEMEDFEVELSWDKHDSDCVTHYRVLRASRLVTDATNLEPFDEVETLDANTYTDAVNEPGIYSYTILGLTDKEDTVPPSETIAIEFDADGHGEVVDQSPPANIDPRLLGTYYAEGFLFAFAEAGSKYQMQVAEGQVDLLDSIYSNGFCIFYYDEAFIRVTDTRIYITDDLSSGLVYSFEDNGDLTLRSVEENASFIFQRVSDSDLSEADTCADLYIESVYGQYISDTTAQISITSYFDSAVDSVDQVAVDFGDGLTQYFPWEADLTVTYPTSLLSGTSEFSVLISTTGGIHFQEFGSYAIACAAGDAYEPNNGYGSATTLTVDAPAISATLTDLSDWFAVQLVGGTSYTFRTNPTDVDTVMSLYDTDGATVLDYQDDVYELAAVITYTPGVSGLYFLAVAPYGEPTCESYTMVATTP